MAYKCRKDFENRVRDQVSHLLANKIAKISSIRASVRSASIGTIQATSPHRRGLRQVSFGFFRQTFGGVLDQELIRDTLMVLPASRKANIQASTVVGRLWRL